jgi:hypothetical protein
MQLPTPLELRSNCKKIHGISNKDLYLDLYQIYTLCQTKNISLLYPDNATQIFTHIYNNTKYRIFEKFIDDICVNSYTAVIHITTIDDSPGRVSTVKLYIPNANSAGYTMKKIPSSKTLSIDDIYQMGITTIAFFFEYSPVPDAQFGHYGGAIYDCNLPDILCIFDSMMTTDADDDKPSEYGPIFESIIKDDVILFDYAGHTNPRVVYDLYRIPNLDNSSAYPLELTGGVIETPNVYIENMHASVGNKQRINRYVYCSDNQNQFCYMWAFLYLVIKLSPRYERENGLVSRNIPDFTTFHKRICERKILPLVIIKTFGFHTFYLTYIQNLNIIRQCILPSVSPSVEECFFMKYFRTFTAFDSQYPDANTHKKDVKLFEMPHLNPIHHTGLRHLSIFDIVPRVIEACDISTIRDITQVESVLSYNPFVFEFVHKQFALAFSRKKSIYTFITGPSSDDNVKITMKAFIKYASKYDDIIINDDTMRIGIDNFKEHMKSRASLSP